MADTTDELIVVVEDDLITAETTNKNNKYLETLMTDYAGELRQYLDNQIAAIEKIPVGTTTTYAGSTPPVGWLVCDGSAVSRETYSALFAVIGITYGEGNGATTFNLPNAIDKFFEGSDTAGTEIEAGLPNITGQIGLRNQMQYSTSPVYDGPFYQISSHYTNNAGDGGTGSNLVQIGFDASRSNPIYGNSETVQPEAITQLPIIKY
jgi:hypothetical protein